MAMTFKLDRAGIEDRLREIRDVYLADARPWVIGFSGGKDSTCALQMVWSALEALPPERAHQAGPRGSARTRCVETPVISRYIDLTLSRIASAGEASRACPIVTEKVTPCVDRSFWVNLIGRGYPAPSRRFRWCTERLKIEPANDFIKGRVAEFGEVVNGARRAFGRERHAGAGDEPAPHQGLGAVAALVATQRLRLRSD